VAELVQHDAGEQEHDEHPVERGGAPPLLQALNPIQARNKMKVM
jgi:hypothetical protein